jgi:hypothetical protein
MQACWESLEKAMPADVKLKYRTNTKTEGKNGGHVSSTVWTNLGEFEFSFWASLYTLTMLLYPFPLVKVYLPL